MGITDWIQDRLFGGNHGIGGMPPAGVPYAHAPQLPGATFGAQAPASFQPGSSNQALQQIGSMYGSHGGPPTTPTQGEEGTPWYKNPDILSAGLSTAGGLAGAYMQQRTQNRQMDAEEQRYREEQDRKKQMSEYLAPIYARIMGQQAPQATPAPHYGAQ